MVAQQTNIQVKCLHECHMSCMKCFYAHISSHSPTPSHMPMPSVTTVTGSTNDTHVLSPYWLTSTQCKCQWVTKPESIPTPITQLEVYVITIIVCIIIIFFWATELFGLHHGSLTPTLNFLDNTAGLLHPYRTFGSCHGSLTPILNFRISPRVSYTQISSL